MDNKCPKCGKKLSLFYLKENCPECGASIIYYNMEERLERDAEKADEEYAKLEKLIDKVTPKFIKKRMLMKKEAEASGIKRKSKKGVFIAVICAVVAVIAGVLLFLFAGTGSNDIPVETAETVAEKAVKAELEFDGEATLECFHEKMIDKWAEDNDQTSDEQRNEWLEAAKKSQADFSEKYGEYTVTTQIISCEKLSDEEFDRVKAMFRDNYGLNVIGADKVEVGFTLDFANDSLEDLSDKKELIVVEVNSKWYIYR